MSEHDVADVAGGDPLVPTARAAVERLVYSVREAAAALDLCPNTIYNLIDRGELRAHKVGRRTLIAVADVRRLVGLEES